MIHRSKNLTSMAAVLLLCALPVPATTATAGFKAPPGDRILKTLRDEHPRLIVDAESIAQLKELIESNPLAARIYASVKTQADRILTQPPSRYEIPDGRRLLSVSRRVKERVRTLAFVFLIERDRRHSRRAWEELRAAAQFKDWNPSHFLDTAEMTHAFAIGYDWLHDRLTEDQRDALRRAMVELGLKPAMKVYERGRGWPRGYNNWNQVCNGGIGIGALAIADREPELAAEILHHAIGGIPNAMEHYAPDGAGTEGVTYWSYGTRYNILFLSALESALGTDFGLSKIPGFEESGSYQMYMSGPSRVSYNFADCGLTHVSTPQHFWMGRTFERPEYSWFRHSALRQNGRGDVLDLLWFDESGRDFDPRALPRDKYYRRAECASIRSAWDDPNSLAIGIQAGDNRKLGGHRHLDLGSFILEASGERWAIDSGTEHETYMGHRHHNPKWKYYRVRAEGHNTLVINPGEGPDQDLEGTAKIVEFESMPDRTKAVVDLAQAYAGHVTRARRTFEMVGRAHVTIADELELKKPGTVWWFMHTEAAVKLRADGTAATLSRNGKRFSVEILRPAGATFTVMPAGPLPTSPNIEKQASNEGRRKLAIRFEKAKDLKLAVSFEPLDR